MSVTIYHNPRCRKSREALEIIRSKGIEPEIIEYLKTPLDAQTLDGILRDMNKEPREAMRTDEDIYKELNLKVMNLGRDALIQTMIDHPKLIERPIVVTDKGTIIARPPEKVREVL